MKVSDIALLVSVLTFCISCIILNHTRPDFILITNKETGGKVMLQEKLILNSLLIGLGAGLLTTGVCCRSQYIKDRKIAMRMGII